MTNLPTFPAPPSWGSAPVTFPVPEHLAKLGCRAELLDDGSIILLKADGDSFLDMPEPQGPDKNATRWRLLNSVDARVLEHGFPERNLMLGDIPEDSAAETRHTAMPTLPSSYIGRPEGGPR